MSAEKPDEFARRTRGVLPYVAPPTAVAFMDGLIDAIPSVGRVIQARRAAESGDVMPYSEMFDLITWSGDRYRESTAYGDRAAIARTELTEFLRRMEDVFEVGDQALDDLVAVGFLEGLGVTKDAEPGLRALLPPKMRRWYDDA